MSLYKYNQDLENPFDKIFYLLVNPILPIFKKIGFTVNTITALSLMFGLISIFFLLHKSLMFIFFFIFSYILDCADGAFARKYNETSKFGEAFDHLKDVLLNVLILGTLLYYYSLNLVFIIIIFLQYYFTFIFYYLNEMKVLKMENSDLNIYTDISKRYSEKKILNYMYIIFAFCLYYTVYPVIGDQITNGKLNFFKYFGTGTLPIVISLIVFLNI